MAEPLVISSRDNARVKEAVELRRSAGARGRAGLFFAEGRRLCQDLAAVARPRVAFVHAPLLAREPALARLANETFVINDPVADKLGETKTPQGLFCLFPMPQVALAALNATGGVLVCEAVQDPANLGAMLRCAAGLGLGGVVLTHGCTDPFSPKALRAAMGSTLRLPLACDVSVSDAAGWLHAQGATVYAAALGEGATPIQELRPKQPFGLLVGNEGAGLGPAALAAADERVVLPMQNGVESLNVATAAAIFIHCLKTDNRTY